MVQNGFNKPQGDGAVVGAQQQSNQTYQMPSPRSAAGITALVLGIIALATSFLPIVNNLSFLLAALGFIFSIAGVVATMKGKKRGKGLAIAALIINVLSVAIVLATQSMYSAALDEAFVSTADVSAASGEGVSVESSETAEASDEESKYTIENEEMVSDGFTTKITGTLTNNTDKEIGYLQVSYALYDADGAQVGSAWANINNLEAGGVWKFEAVAFEEGIASYKLSEVTGF